MRQNDQAYPCRFKGTRLKRMLFILNENYAAMHSEAIFRGVAGQGHCCLLCSISSQRAYNASRFSCAVATFFIVISIVV